MTPAKTMEGKTCLVTGANSGIGFETSKELARLGCYVVLACRDTAKGNTAIEAIRQETGSISLESLRVDLSSLDSVRELARNFKQKHDRLHVLVNNAGLILGKRVITVDGLEETFQVNYLSHFLLTNLLLDILKSSAPSRIVNISSDAHFSGKVNFEDLQGEKGYSAMKSYAQSKLAQVLFTHELSEKLKGTGVTVNAVHPGAVRTRWGDEAGALGIGIRLARPFLISPEKGARTPVYVATSPEAEGVTGKYYAGKRIKESSRESNSAEEARELWAKSLKLSGLE